MVAVADICVKVILLILNFLFATIGGGLFVLGVIGELALRKLEEPDLAKYQTVPIVLIAVGAFVFLIAFMGCCGAFTDSNFTLAVYAIFKVLLTILFVGAGVLVYTKQQLLVDYLMQFENDLFILNPTKFMQVESLLKCCGPEGTLSYSGRPSSTCCIDSTCTNYFPKCSLVTAKKFHDYDKYIAGGFISIGALELLGAVMSLCLASIVRRDGNSR